LIETLESLDASLNMVPILSHFVAVLRESLALFRIKNAVFLRSAAAMFLLAATVASAAPTVSVSENDFSYTLKNGIVTAVVSKRSGDLISLNYRNLELLAGGSGHPYGYWSHSPNRAMRLTNGITIDPESNGGARAEVSVKGFYTGESPRRSTPGANSSTACDIEIRYALGRGESGLYTYSIFTHQTNYPATGIGEARFGVKLNPEICDYLTIDSKRRKLMPKPEDWDQGTELNFKEARRLNTGIYKGQVSHKYDLSAIQFDIPAYGWSSTRDKISLWFVNPSIEYLSGGATKVELTGHLDNNEGAVPTLLNYWRGSHYGGSICAIGESERWSKVIGPFLIYCNAGADPEVMWKDALRKAVSETKAWPYDWVEGVDYPHERERGTVRGQIVLDDPFAPNLQFSNMLVGLAAPDYAMPPFNRRPSTDDAETNQFRVPPSAGLMATNESGESNQNFGRFARRGRGGFGGPRTVDWQNDAKFYQFWTRADERGRFTIGDIRPGNYTLHVIADGVLGEGAWSNITVTTGARMDLGKLNWRPERFGKPLWEIGIPNRSAEEFRHGDHYWQWGLYNQYTNDFPQDVQFVIGRSNYHTDWNYAQVPRSPDTGTTWTIAFNLTNAPAGKATLRIGIAGVSLRGGVEVSVNDEPVGNTGFMADTATIRRDGIRGYWLERNVAFGANLLKRGSNTLKLSIPPGHSTSGILYDYLRLELAESK